MYAARSARSVLLAAVAAFTSLLAFAAPPGQLAMAAETCTISAKLVNSCRPWLGAASGGYGKSGFRTHIEYHEARAGRQVDIAHDYLQPGQLLTSDERYFAGRANTILLLNWKPVDSWAKGSGSNASANAYIDQMADQIKGLGTTRIMLNLNHEPENDVSSGGAPSCGTKRLSGRMGSAADYVTMWHNVRARFDARGVSNVVWVMNYMGWTNWYCMTRDLWPGNDYVDWVMWDPYPNVATWQSHVSGFYDYLLSVNDAQHDFASKPWGLAEYGYKGTSQTAAYQMYADVRLNLDRFSRLRAYSVWDNSGNLDVRVGYSSKGVLDQKEQDAYNTLVRDPVFQGTTVPADSQAPTVPTGLAGTGLAGTGGVSVELTWNAATDNTGVTGYTVQRDGVGIGTVATRGYSDTGVAAGQSYAYRVAALDAAGNSSAFSAPVTVTVPFPAPDVTAPSIPEEFTATPVDGATSAVRLAWHASTDDRAVASYTVLRDGEPLVELPAATLHHTDDTVKAGTEYRYAVLATDTSGNASEPSAAVKVTAPEANPVDTTPPGAPGGLTASVTGFTPKLVWTAATDDRGVVGYRVYRGGTLLDTTTGLTYSDPAAPLGATSTYTVRALDEAGNLGPASNSAAATVQRDSTAPSRVGTLTAVVGAVGSRSITLSWGAATDNHRIGSYWLYRGNVRYLQLSGTTTSYTDTGLTAGTAYTYKVYALDASNNWGPSSGNVTATAR